ncbi:MAG: hypothetical protein JWQ38_2293 [Flavipsychrobacter sp.]|nr:hypothetical protein [Flavipsychrobacter sp.]
MTPAVKDVDTYLSLVPEEMRAALEKLRQQIKKLAPDAEEVISYGMPMYKYHGTLVGFAAFKNHCGFYAANGTAVEQYKEELKDYSTSKGTIRFTPDKPIPAAVIKMIVKDKMKANLEKSKLKKK